MTQADDEVAGKIAKLLDKEVAGMEDTAVQRLAAARKAALARYGEQPSSAWELAFVGKPAAGARYAPHPRRFALRLTIFAVAVAAALAVSFTWQVKKTSFADIDEALLTDDLPINAYLDKSFDSWINRASH